MFTNQGTIELRNSFTSNATLYLASDTTLTGSGEVVMVYDSTGWPYWGIPVISGPEGATLTVGAEQRIHGAGQIALDVINQGTIEADRSGQGLTLSRSLTNIGTVKVVNGGTLSVGTALTDTGTFILHPNSNLTLSGPVTTLMDLQALTGSTLRLVNVTMVDTNRTIAAVGGTVQIVNSTITAPAIQTIAANGGVVEIVNSTIAVPTITANGGIVAITNSILSDGTLVATDHASSLVRFSGDVTLNGVPWEDPGTGEFQVHGTTRLLGDYETQLPAGYRLVVQSGWWAHAQLTLSGGVFTNQGTIELRNSSSSNATLYLASDTTLAGSGEVVMVSPVGWAWPSWGIPVISGPEGATLTVGAEQRLHGEGQIGLDVVNQGMIEADRSGFWLEGLTISNGLTNTGTVGAVNGATLRVNGPFTVDNLGQIVGRASGVVSVRENMLGDTRNADRYAPLSEVRFDGSGTVVSPQLMEVMGKDLGAVSEGFSRNFVYSTLSLSSNTYVRLVDQSDNAAGAGAEALYVNSLVVPVGTTLDLNGLHLYMRAAQVNGTIVGGRLEQVPDSGPIVWSAAASGSIGISGEIDEWTFFGRAGRSVTVALNPGSGTPPTPLLPYLGYAQVQLLDANDNVLATASNGGYGQNVIFTDVALPADGNYRIQVRASAGHSASTGNYLITLWDITADVTPLLLNQQRNGAIETLYSVDRWTFSAVAGQQVRFDLVNTSGPGVTFNLTGPDGWVGFSDIPADSDLITLPTSGSYTLTARGIGAQYGGTYAFRLQETVQIVLPPGTTYNGTFAGSGQAQLFRVDVPESMPMQLVLDDSSAANRNELYVKFGAPPTRGDYDYRSSALATADQKLLVPMATAGTWYVLVYGDSISTPSNYMLLATTSALAITGVTPDHHGNTAAATLTLNGAGFDSTTTVELVAEDGVRFPADVVEVDSFTQMMATFAADTVPAGTYSIHVARLGGDSAQLADAFQMISGGRPQLETNLVIPGNVGRHAIATLFVEYANTGEVAMPAPLLVLNGTDNALMTLDQSKVVSGFWTSARPEGFSDTIQILASGETPGVLQPGESFRVPVHFAGLLQPWNFNDGQVEFNLGVLTADNTSIVDWAALKDDLRPDSIRAAAWDPLWANFTTQAGDTWGDYVTMLDDNAAYLGRLGERVVDVGSLLAFEFLQADGLSPIRSLASAVDAAVEAPGLPLTFARTFSEPISQRYELGPFGYGWAHSWQMSLQQDADGTVTISGPAGSRRTFQPDSRGGYFPQAGDHATLAAIGGGAFTLREPDGLLYAFRADGKLNYVGDPNGNRITADYTGDRFTGLTHSSGQTLQIAYNEAGRIQGVIDQVGRQTTFTYDGANEHLISVQDYDGQTTTYTYDTSPGASTEHALTAIEYPGGTHQYFTYDAQGRPASLYRDGNAETVTFAYDSAGRVSTTDATGGTGQFFFDHRGLLVKTEDALSNAVHLSFDDSYNLTSVTDPTGRSYTYSYDARGNLTRSTDSLGHTTRFTYTGPFNRLASLTDANGNLTRYAYDNDGNLQSITYADRSIERWTYDPLGNPDTWTNRRGHAIGYTYDADGRITSKLYADGSHVDYTYDARGNLLTATDATGTNSLTYDANDYLTRIDYPGGRSLEFTYDAAGRRASSLDQLGHRLDYHYDAVGRLESLTDEGGNEIVHYAYDDAGRLSRKDLGNGVYTTYEYDAAGQLLHLVNSKPDSSVLSRFDYTYDSRGRRTSMGTLDGQWTYEYDDTEQLTHAVLDSTNPDIPDQDLRYEYDALGNRIRTIENGVTTEYTTNNLNQYTQVGDTTYVFDADGNLIQEVSPQGTMVFTYNDENRLIAVASSDGTWQYTYDAFGNRVATTENGVTTRYVIDPIGLGNVVGEYDASGDLVAHYGYGFGLLSRIDSAGSAAYYSFDAIGNASEMITAAGSIANRYEYAPFGRVLQETAPLPNPFLFVGQWGVMMEPTGLEFMRSRYYASGIGRFTQDDPIGLLGGDDNVNRYAGNSPIEMIDPSGMLQTRDPLKRYQLYLDASRKRGAYEVASEYNCYSGEGFNHSEAYDGYDIEWRTFMDYVTNTLDVATLEPVEISLYQQGKTLEALIALVPNDLWRFFASKNKPIKGDGIGDALNYLGKAVFLWDREELAAVILAYYDRIEYMDSQSIGVARSDDPNAKTGPAGFGSAGFISPESIFPYRVDFENEVSATAPAQQVVITDQLDSDLDWSSFELTEIGFGDWLIAVPDNTQHYETTMPMSYNGVDFEVQVEAGINASTGQVYATFYSIDPTTGLPPSVNTGFLPPEDETGRGQGHFSYLINPKANLATGTEIRNIALISFDGHPQIATNQVDPHDPFQGTDPNKEALNTIDAGAPGSNVLPLPPTIAQTDILVQWAGEDDTGGSGIASYDLYVSTDGGAYALWMDDTAETSATYSGQPGHSYAFYSVARDPVGHLEAAPEIPDAQITVLEGRFEGVKFEDLDGDSVRDEGEPGLAGWIIYLDQDRSGQREEGERFATTDETGAYSFSGLVPGPYGVAEELQAGWIQTAPEGGTHELVLTGEETVTGIDFGNFQPGRIAGVKFHDPDGDGVQDEGEPGLEGWTVYLDANGNGTLDEGETRTTTEGTGAYSFTDLGPGTYRVAEVTKTGWSQTVPAGGFYQVALTSGLVATGRDFGGRLANTAPVAADDAYAVEEDGVLTVDAPGVLGNDTDGEGDSLAAALVNGPAHGALTLNPNGSFGYTPAPNFSGTDTFTYLAQDGKAESAPATVTITVNEMPELPVNVDGKVRLTYTGYVLNRSTNTFDTLATLSNLSTDVLDGPMSLVVTGITPSSVSLANPSGQTADGKPLINVPVPPGGLAPGASIPNILLKFSNPSRVRFTFTISVWAIVQPSPQGALASFKASAPVAETALPASAVQPHGRLRARGSLIQGMSRLMGHALDPTGTASRLSDANHGTAREWTGQGLGSDTKGADATEDGATPLLPRPGIDHRTDRLGNFPRSGSQGPGASGRTALGAPSPWLHRFLLDLAASEDTLDPNRGIQVLIPTSVDVGL
ncbi:MAG: cadherin-like domain-containing protein [Candidatus Tectomicrobia bacterium]|uniref:Cadherin-like domain-containing protein n=1 Tax=Tectimicrobiota bacterium TaxID=2528274 RepID=A0A932FZI1_UNCTE|nr:cadherin-like domain-containing protein [Candidatus Tectomicrobia bacterium]